MLPLLIFALVLCVVAWWAFRKPSVPDPVSSSAALAPKPSRVHTGLAQPVETLEYGSDGVPIHPRGSAEPPPNTATHPHGFTPVHERIYRENNLLGQLDGAMDARDVQGMRRLLEQYSTEYPEDSHEMQVGYRLIADCLEFPKDHGRRAAAQRYYDTEIQSGLRRYIRRHCLDNGG